MLTGEAGLRASSLEKDQTLCIEASLNYQGMFCFYSDGAHFFKSRHSSKWRNSAFWIKLNDKKHRKLSLSLNVHEERSKRALGFPNQILENPKSPVIKFSTSVCCFEGTKASNFQLN